MMAASSKRGIEERRIAAARARAAAGWRPERRVTCNGTHWRGRAPRPRKPLSQRGRRAPQRRRHALGRRRACERARGRRMQTLRAPSSPQRARGRLNAPCPRGAWLRPRPSTRQRKLAELAASRSARTPGARGRPAGSGRGASTRRGLGTARLEACRSPGCGSGPPGPSDADSTILHPDAPQEVGPPARAGAEPAR